MPEIYTPNPNPYVGDSFDYIIVGAGSAGCVLANRLTEDGSATACVIEAGEKAKGWTPYMPAAMLKTCFRADLNWGFQSEAESALNNRKLGVLRGKVLGGSSQINGMAYVRGDRHDYDDWSALGCKGWSYREVLPYFRRAENSWAGETQERGGRGLLGVNISKTPSLRFDDYRQAAINAGYPAMDRIDNDELEGVTRTEMTVGRDGRRSSTWVAYLRPALPRRNLKLMSGAHARRIILEGNRAAAVEYTRGDQQFSVRARREIILTSGSYGSPQLLLLSGIGPAQELRALGIEPALNLPGVGRNLTDHPMMYMSFRARPRTFANELRFDRAAISALRWAVFGSGPFTTNGLAAQIFCRTDPNWNRADVQMSCLAVDTQAGIWFPLVNKPVHGLSIALMIIRSDSRGKVTLRSANYRDPPSIRFNLMQERSDVDRMIRAMRAAREVYAQEPLRSLIIEETLPGAAFVTDEELVQVIREQCTIAEHPIGTCKMGVDQEAVVSPELKVHGIEGLRVVDASVMPTIPTGNTNAPAIMIAEKAADHIRRRL
jgi:choline dehydrogenase